MEKELELLHKKTKRKREEEKEKKEKEMKKKEVQKKKIEEKILVPPSDDEKEEKHEERILKKAKKGKKFIFNNFRKIKDELKSQRDETICTLLWQLKRSSPVNIPGLAAEEDWAKYDAAAKDIIEGTSKDYQEKVNRKFSSYYKKYSPFMKKFLKKIGEIKSPVLPPFRTEEELAKEFFIFKKYELPEEDEESNENDEKNEDDEKGDGEESIDAFIKRFNDEDGENGD